MKKVSVIAMILVVSVGLFAFGGCKKKDKRISVRISVLGSAEEYDAYKALAKKYMKLNPGIKILTELAAGANTRAQIMTRFSGEASADIVDIHYTWFHEFAERGLFEDLTHYMKAGPIEMWDDYFPVAREVFCHKGVQRGIPLRCSAMVFYYNKNRFEKCHVPFPADDWTWSDLETTSRAVSGDFDKDGKQEHYSFFMGTTWDFYIPWIRMAGGRLMSKDGQRLVFDSPQALSVLSMFYKWCYEDKVLPSMLARGDIPFRSGLTAMSFSGPWNLTRFGKIKSFEWDLAYIPKHASGRRITGLGATGLCLWSKSKKKNEAWQYIQFLFARKNLEFKAKCPGNAEMPPARPVAYSDLIIKPETSYHEEYFVKSIEFAQAAPYFPDSSNIIDVIKEELEKMYSIRQDPTLTGKNITRRTNILIQKARNKK